ncbi:hypothetical protein B7C51_25000 (plasmid) [Paenibacillus larvae subsp. pulvifaciens]|uniref:Uncharacterized protein n=1 Tax=Paenibacillus larvae subsp. pulvifaciens TaxID=1477 RepID=A0A1V0V037_9BACL|nr:hypothetical protein [Paenibacillus larvae]ARF70733.1 hypothetical protein B7C51_25000 [Paenibacillus larvae subsp. pulvifaciens]
MNKFKQIVAKIETRDTEESQARDFDDWLNYLAEYPQGLYDMLLTDFEWSGLSEEEVRERKAILDATYVYIQSAIEDISTVLKRSIYEWSLIICLRKNCV